jgi:hypothetical protein
MKKTKSSKPPACTRCASAQLTRHIATYPVRLTAPEKLAGKEIHVGRVALYQCDACGQLMPTPAGQAKVDRCVQRGIELFLGQLR